MTEKRYDPHKKVKLSEITGAFINYTTTTDLTKSEYLLIQNVYNVVMEKLNDGDDSNDWKTPRIPNTIHRTNSNPKPPT